jgi:hypothetical protein
MSNGRCIVYIALFCLALGGGCGGDIAGLEADGNLTAARLDSLLARPRGIYVESRTTVRAAPEAVWAVLSDLNRWREWNPAVLRAQTAEGDALEWGIHFTQTYATRPLEVTARSVVVRIVPGREMVWRGTLPGLCILHAVSLRAAADGGTEVLGRERMVGLVPLLFKDRLRAGAQRASQAAFEGLRAFCEALPPPPPPPREAPEAGAADTTAADTTAAAGGN